MTKRWKRHSPEQIVRKWRDADAMRSAARANLVRRAVDRGASGQFVAWAWNQPSPRKEGPIRAKTGSWDLLYLGLSAQVLAEFYWVATTKSKSILTHDEALRLPESLASLPLYPITRELVLEAAILSHKSKISYWDAAILTSARLMGCKVVYSEDLNDGQEYDGVQVVNPFALAEP